MPHHIDTLKAPLFVSWQITRDCDLCCLHCCTESAPGKRLRDELSPEDALRIVDDIVGNDVPYVMLCGGEPLVVPHFFLLAEALGRAGVWLKIETNGQRFDAEVARRLARLPVRSVQVSLDGDTDHVYQRQRPGASLAKAHAACRAARAAGLPLEITFAPTRLNIHEAGAVISRARSLGAFRFNTGKLMRIGTAARLWDGLEPSIDEYDVFFGVLELHKNRVEPEMELCYIPRDIDDGLRRTLDDPPATMLILPNGFVKIAAALPYVCADLRECTLHEAWKRYCDAWHDDEVLDAARRAIGDSSLHVQANSWRRLAPMSDRGEAQ